MLSKLHGKCHLDSTYMDFPMEHMRESLNLMSMIFIWMPYGFAIGVSTKCSGNMQKNSKMLFFPEKNYNPCLPMLHDTLQVVVIDGNIAVGKTEFAKKLAERFDLKFFPPTREKQLFMDTDGYNCDLRRFDPLLPEGVKSYDLKKFYADPNPERGLVGRLQLQWYREKFFDYLLALRHLANTGL